MGQPGTISTLTNTGTISGNSSGIYNSNIIGAISNSGTITGGLNAINNGGSLGAVTNSGLIAGNIRNTSSNSLTINGGSGSTFGTLTGSSGGIGSADMGTISNTAASLIFGSGNLLLNDNINAGSGTVSNTGATLQLNNRVSITGNYHQSASAALLVGVSNAAVTNGVTADTGYGRLVVSGSAVIASGSSITLKPVSSYNFAVGQRYVVVQAAISGTNYNAANLLYSATGYTGSLTGSVVADGSNSNLLVTLGTTGSGGSGGSSASLKSYGLIAYAGYTVSSWYLDLSGGVVRHKYSTTRLIDFTGFSGTANGSYNGTQSVLSAEGGYPIRLDDVTVLTPVAGLNYSKLNQNGYTETGGNGAALTVAGSSSSSLKSTLGAKLERSYVTSYGNLAPSVQLGWRHEYRDTRLMSVASFAADSSGATSFTTFGAKPVTNTGVMALSATLTRSNNMTLTARYSLEAGGGYKSQTADVRLRHQF